MSAPPLTSDLLTGIKSGLGKAWADWYTALGVTQSGLGTMATQNANAVAISGGEISGTTITFSTGTFTPTLVSSGGGAPTYSLQVGTYSVIGNRVFVNIGITLASYGTLAAGNLTVAGIPFTSDAAANHSNVLSAFGNRLAATAATAIFAQVDAGTAVISISRYNAGTTTQLTKADTSATTLFRISGAYQV